MPNVNTAKAPAVAMRPQRTESRAATRAMNRPRAKMISNTTSGGSGDRKAFGPDSSIWTKLAWTSSPAMPAETCAALVLPTEVGVRCSSWAPVR